MAGRPPTPTPILKAQGTYREDRHARRADGAFPRGKPTCPKFLTGEARSEWNRQVKALAQAGVLSLVDRVLLAAWCATWQQYVEAEGDNGERRRLVDALVKLGREFGFSPVARAKVATTGQAPEVDALDEFLEGAG
jgi:phage terminase small subunit